MQVESYIVELVERLHQLSLRLSVVALLSVRHLPVGACVVEFHQLQSCGHRREGPNHHVA